MHRSDTARAIASLPRRAREHETFSDALYEWMERAPWLAISFAAHLIFYFLLAAVPWSEFRRDEVTVIQASLTPLDEPFFEPEEIEVIEKLDLPVVDDVQVVERTSEVDAVSDAPAESDSPVDAPFEPSNFDNAVLGIGPGGGGGPGGPRGRGVRRREAPERVQATVRAGLEWLAEHQSADGRWDGDEFADECDLPPPLADGEGSALHDVGLSSLALLAFLGWGDTPTSGEYADNIRRGLTWLRSQRDPDTGRIGAAATSNAIYDHAIATLVLCEALAVAPNPLLARDARAAVDFVQRARSPYSGWRYAVPPDGSADTSVTGWMVLALAGARKAGLAADPAAFRDAVAWVDQVTDPRDGRTGYTALGQGSARPPHLVDAYPVALTEALTAAGLLTRALAAQALDQPLVDSGSGAARTIALGVDRLLALAPAWDPSGDRVDLYYWYYASYALHQLADRHPRAWREWERALVDALAPAQRTAPACFAGSFDPIGPWGEEGGRVYATAIAVLSLEVFFRYERP